ncbi:hypothetical protein C8R45DRAFT_1053067 [Mycena sanguinolenta]|nr:hypothetical protein C8R45DRAFT_1053067 [Mycena sanguinolenta]
MRCTQRLIPDTDYSNGLISTVVKSYNRHHALFLRPDDVWLSILCQFYFFVNANAELMRASSVAHEGKRELTIINIGSMACQMNELINKTVPTQPCASGRFRHLALRLQLIRTVASVMLMATLKQYFEMRFVGTTCGNPRADWVDILGRLEKLKEYGVETIAWYHLQRPVIARFVHAFDAPDSEENVAFWNKIRTHRDQTSTHGPGDCYYSGWINAFNAQRRGSGWVLRSNLYASEFRHAEEALESMNAVKFWETYEKAPRTELVYDGTPYHRLDTKNIAPGYAMVDLTLDDNGVLFRCVRCGDKMLSKDGKDDTVRPVAGWWMFANKEE